VADPVKPPPKPMTMSSMRRSGVRWLKARCMACRHDAEVQADGIPDEVEVPRAGRGMVCSKCGSKNIDTWPAWGRREG
jgi:DNA-directed RNA polymerase subunit RPC12/RpoP